MKSRRKGKLEPKRKVGRDPVMAPVQSVLPSVVSWSIPALIALVTFAAFLPALSNGFVNWDDEKHLLDNRHYRGLGWVQLRWMFTTFHIGHYQPLSWVTFGLDYLVWEMDPFGYHLTSLLLHTANAVFFYFLALRLLSLAESPSGESSGWVLRGAAGFSALFFAVHPLRVESVAWATERRDVLSGLFLLSTVLLYLQAVRVRDNGSRWRRLSVTIAVYVLSLLSKATGITLPIILLVLDVYPLRRLGGGEGKWFGKEARPIWWEKIPFLLVAMLAGVIALLAQKVSAMITLETHGVAPRLAQALYGVVFYLWKTVLPVGLSPLYQLPPHLDPWDWRFVLSGVVVVLLSVGVLVVRHRWPAGLAVWIYYGALLAPVLGIAQSGPQLVADRYSYLSCLGWSVIWGAALYRCWRGRAEGATRRWISASAVGVATAITLVLGILTWQQTQIWRDSEILWRRALEIDQNSEWAYNNLGTALLRQARLQEAAEQFKKAAQINPDYALAYYNLGMVLTRQGDLEGAIKIYRQVAGVEQDSPKSLNHLAIALATKGKFAEAIELLQRALKSDKNQSESYFNLANVLVMEGHLKEAVSYFERALAIQPDFAEAHDRLGRVYAAQGKLKEATEYFRNALAFDPELSEAQFDLATALAKQGKLDMAIQHFEMALAIRPDYAEAHNNLGRVLASQGDLSGAMDHFRQALRIRPDFSAAHESLAMALAEQGNRDEAIRHHQEALRIMNSGPKAGAPDKKGLLGFDIAR